MRIVLCVMLIGLLSACSSKWSYAQVDNMDKSANVVPTNPEAITVTELDITDRPYKVLGDITVTVNKTTVFSQTPTKSDVNDKLRQEAAGMGADAVIFARYGDAGISLMSWGAMEGRGRAVKFQ